MVVQPSGRRDALRRLRWRRRGAWQWPLFAVMTVADAALLHWLPMAGTGAGWVGGILLAGCLNLIAIALLGRLGGRLLRRRRPDLPKVVAEDYAGSVLLGMVAAVFLTIGLVHRPEILEDRRAAQDGRAAALEFLRDHGDRFTRAHIAEADTLTLLPTLFRTCAPSPDPRRFECVFVDTSAEPIEVRPDRNRESNASLSRAGGFRR